MEDSYLLQYDMGLRLWVLCAPDGDVVRTFVSRHAALTDPHLLALAQRGARLRVRNADGSFDPLPRRRARVLPTPAAHRGASGEALVA